MVRPNSDVGESIICIEPKYFHTKVYTSFLIYRHWLQCISIMHKKPIDAILIQTRLFDDVERQFDWDQRRWKTKEPPKKFIFNDLKLPPSTDKGRAWGLCNFIFNMQKFLPHYDIALENSSWIALQILQIFSSMTRNGVGMRRKKIFRLAKIFKKFDLFHVIKSNSTNPTLGEFYFAFLCFPRFFGRKYRGHY